MLVGVVLGSIENLAQDLRGDVGRVCECNRVLCGIAAINDFHSCVGAERWDSLIEPIAKAALNFSIEGLSGLSPARLAQLYFSFADLENAQDEGSRAQLEMIIQDMVKLLEEQNKGRCNCANPETCFKHSLQELFKLLDISNKQLLEAFVRLVLSHFILCMRKIISAFASAIEDAHHVERARWN